MRISFQFLGKASNICMEGMNEFSMEGRFFCTEAVYICTESNYVSRESTRIFTEVI